MCESSCQSEAEPDVHPLLLSELVNYMVETSLSSEGSAIFPLADISQLCTQRLKQLGIDSPSVNKARLKELLLMEIPELEAHKKGRSVLLAQQKDVVLAVSQASEYSDALVLAKAAKILRKHILDHQSKFDGTFREGCIKDAVPASLLQFIGMLEHGQTLSLTLSLAHQSQTRLLLSSCTTTVSPNRKNRQLPIDILRIGKLPFQCTWVWLSIPRPGR